MRTVFINHLIQQAELDSSIYLITGDLGFSVLEKFKEKFPDRFINAGIAEQNMIGMAAGLAMTGKKVFLYSIIPFITMRCFEQIRNDICYQQLSVKLVGVGGGLSYAPFGLTHHAVEDVAIMRALPTMTIVAPGSKYETEYLAPAFCNNPGPGYLRLSNNQELVTYQQENTPKLGKILDVIPNTKNIILASGNALDLGFMICKQLAEQGISIGLASVHTLKPLDKEYLSTKQKGLQSIFTLEEHSVIGGLGEAVSKIVCEEFNQKIKFKVFGINDFYFHETGSRQDLLAKAGLTSEKICAEITTVLSPLYISKKALESTRSI